ncbi:MAG: murein biosynthesis integral membrane protein MurJ [Propionibacteriaceae bacterium]|nr:murein biosynthesis integral membrane protein MurJ [Propionibacteriaceae bacterium]
MNDSPRAGTPDVDLEPTASDRDVDAPADDQLGEERSADPGTDAARQDHAAELTRDRSSLDNAREHTRDLAALDHAAEAPEPDPDQDESTDPNEDAAESTDPVTHATRKPSPVPSVTPTDPGGVTKRLLRALAVMGSGTMVSRILGLVRVALVAYVIGNGTAQADIYAVAITIPTALYILFAGGALNSVLVPQLTRAAKHDDDGGEAYTNRITTAFLLILAIVATIATLAAPLITQIYSSDRWRSPELADHYQAMVFLTMVTMPEVFFYGAFVVLGQILNARDRFGPMMWAPVASNIIQVLSMVVFLGAWGKTDGHAAFSSAQIWVLGGGYLLGAIVQAAVMVVFLRRVGYRFRPRFDLKGTGLGKTFKLAGWAVAFVLVNQVALAVVSRLATSATAGGSGAGLTVYNNAYLVFLLPHSLITVSLATAMVTSASRLAAAGDKAGTAAEVMRTMRLVAAALVPAAILLIALAHPIARLLFGNGTGAKDAPLIGWTIMALAAGLVPFTLQHVCLRTYYALERNRDTFFIQVLIAAVQIGLSLALVLSFDNPATVAPMLGLALSAAYVVGLFVSFNYLRKSLPHLRGQDVIQHVARVALAVLPGAALAWLITDRIGDGLLLTLVGLAIGGIVTTIAYLGLAQVLRITEITQIVSRLRNRGKVAAVTADPGVRQPAGAAGGVPRLNRTKAGVRNETGEEDQDASSVDPDRTHAMATDPTAQDPATDPAVDHEADLVTRVHATLDKPQSEVVAAVDPKPVAPAGDDGPGGDVDDEDEHDTAEEVHPIQVRSGRVLGGRYQLDEMLVRRAETQTWKATDRVLSRAVLIHLLPAGQDDIQLLAAARRAAVATDSRFLRVLDAQSGDDATYLADADPDPETDGPVGPYIVCEYAPGLSLERLLTAGPLSALEAAWVVREVADGLAGMHDQGLFHERINPDTIVITATGNVKIVGFLLESELAPLRHHPLIPSADPERVDVADLGRLLYCTLVSRWPGGEAHGMAAAPVDSDGQLLTPRQVRAGVSPALDTICDRILSPVPRQREEPLRTAHEVVRALTHVLGTANAAQDLERRLRYPIPVVRMDNEPALSDGRHVDAIDTAAGLPLAPLADPDAPTGRLPVVSVDDPTDEYAPVTVANETSYPELDQVPGDPPRRWIGWLVVLTLIVLLGSLIAVGMRMFPAGGGEPQALPISGAIDFDPEGEGQTPRSENTEQVPLAHDGNPATAWTTVAYRNADMDKTGGVGVIFDLGEVRKIKQAELLLVGSGAGVELRVPAHSMNNLTLETIKQQKSVGDWNQVAERLAGTTGAGGTGGDGVAPEQSDRERVTLTPEKTMSTRFVLVLFNELPPSGATFTGGIAEAVFWG